MNKHVKQCVLVLGLLMPIFSGSLSGCSLFHPSSSKLSKTNSAFSDSGTLILSRSLPTENATSSAPEDVLASVTHPEKSDASVSQVACNASSEPNTSTRSDVFGHGGYAPLLSYIPPPMGFTPATNEAWLQIEKNTKTVTLYRGEAVVSQFTTEGVVSIDSGVYSLQHKQKHPSWYAPDSYFKNRQLAVPPSSDPLRFRKGALGEFALFPTSGFPIHSGSIWSDEVGGLKMSKTDLVSIYYMLPVGATVVVK